MMGLGRSLLIVVLAYGAMASAWAAEEAAAPSQLAATQPQLDLGSFLFFENAELNFSLGLEKTKGEVFLILEMDHNPSRNEFVLRFDRVAQDVKVQMLQRENAFFGFNNKLVLNLPLIEVNTVNPHSARFVMDAENHRTSQRINLTKLMNELAKETMLFDEKGNLYRAEDIREVILMTKKSFIEKGEGQVLNQTRIVLDELQNERIVQLIGEKPLSDIVDAKRYRVGNNIKLREGYKLPHRTADTQWVALPHLSTSEYVTYKLVKNPELGQRYLVKSGLELSERVLPKIPEGLQWVKEAESAKQTVYVLKEKFTGVSSQTLARYVNSLVMSLAQSTPETALSSVLTSLRMMPLQMEEARMESMAKSILTLESPEQVLDFLTKEQEIILQSQAKQNAALAVGSCRKYLF